MSENDAAPRVVVGVDGSEHSKHALQWGQHLAGLLGGSVEAVATWRYPLVALTTPGRDPQWDAEQMLNQTLAETFGATLPAGLTTAVVEGEAAHALVEASAGAAALVVGSRGLGGFKRLMLGSVSAQCVEHASCPVLIAREPFTSAAG